jgi:predicted O-linked N-acetylglucosamine transferase (SPINDLY family)
MPPNTAMTIPARFQQAQSLHQRGNLANAQAIYEQILTEQADHFGALHFLGVIAAQTNQAERAVELMAKSISLDATSAVAYNNYGNALAKVRRYPAALESYDRAIALNPGYADAYFNRGLAYLNLEHHQAAIDSFDGAIAANENNPDAYFKRATAFSRLKNHAAALADYDRAIACRANFAEAYSNRGMALKELGKIEAALTSYTRAIALKPDSAEAYSNRGVVQKELRRWQAALADYDKAIELRPGFADAYNNRANAWQHLKQYAAAIGDYDRVIALDPEFKFAFGMRQHARLQLCDWDCFAAELTELTAKIERGAAAANPFCLLATCGSPRLQRTAAQIWVREKCPPSNELTAIRKRARHQRIRIGYFSADFCEHPVSYLTAELFETHDRARFETTAFAFGAPVEDAMRRRLVPAFEHFIDVHEKSDREIALLARQMEIDIAVDLGGFTQNARPRIFAMRAAPLQVSYLGYLGTLGASYMDYLLADATIIPPAVREHYAENILYLPSYQANDSKRTIADRAFTRVELGLPPAGFVFCCFNNSCKITPPTFDGWMRILKRVPGSVLYLYADVEPVEVNLRKEARRRGVDGERLIFGKRLPRAEYLARYRAADLFLDTLPYNAGATASDALWAGLPVLTCRGETFAGRVAASLLDALELPELIAADQAQYEDLAVALATDDGRLDRLERRLADHRLTKALFNTRQFTRNLEAAYAWIYQRYQADLPPETLPAEKPSAAQLPREHRDRPAGPFLEPRTLAATIAGLLQHAVELHQQGEISRAGAIYSKVIELDPVQPDALQLLGVVLTQSGDAERGAELISRSLAINPAQPAAHANLGHAQLALRRFGAALASYDRAIAQWHHYAPAHNGRGSALVALQRPDEALPCFERALELMPDFPEALGNRALALCALWRFAEALADCDRALRIRPGLAEAHYAHAVALLGLGRVHEVLAEADAAPAAGALHTEWSMLRGDALRRLGRVEAAALEYQRVLDVHPKLPEALLALATLATAERRFDQAAALFARLLKVAPERDFYRGVCLHSQLHVFDWSDYRAAVRRIITDVDLGKKSDLPFTFLAISGDPHRQQRCARAYAAALPKAGARLHGDLRTGHPRIRVAYVSADFLEHPMAYLLAGLFESHDRRRFEIIAISLRADSASPTAHRLETAFDRFIDVSGQSDEQIARLIAALEVDIAVDLMGYTAEERPGILARRPAPVQVSYIGFPATMGSAHVDYLLADPFVIPPDAAQFYDESIAYLPVCFQANDARRVESAAAATRPAAGLPVDGFVWCAFHASVKLNPPLFDVWCRLLDTVPDSVLWLVANTVTAEFNLRREAFRRGIDPARVVFAHRVPYPQHLARLGLADVCLDTWPFNGGATTSDALWCGVPVVTMTGGAFASRMSGSLLHAVGLPELVTDNFVDYQRIAAGLATDRDALMRMRTRLAQNRAGSPLFDTQGFRRYIESAYATMWERQQRGEAAASFHVPLEHPSE